MLSFVEERKCRNGQVMEIVGRGTQELTIKSWLMIKESSKYMLLKCMEPERFRWI